MIVSDGLAEGARVGVRCVSQGDRRRGVALELGGVKWTRTPHPSPEQGPSFLLIVMLTILFLWLGCSQEGEVTSLFRQLHARGDGGGSWQEVQGSVGLRSTASDRGAAKGDISILRPNRC